MTPIVTSIVEFFSGAFWRDAMLALMHTLWIGVLATIFLWIALRRTPAGRPELRYGMAVIALLFVVVGGLVALAILERPAAPAQSQIARTATAPGSSVPDIHAAPWSPASAGSAGIQSQRARTIQAGGMTVVSPANPSWSAWLAGVWLIGFALMLLRMARSVALAGRVRRRCRALTDSALRTAIEELRAALGIARRIKILVCDEILAPCVIGVFWPAVLIPGSMLTGLPPEHLRAILAHELAHIRRHDTLVNLLQMFVEALLFFNPAVWWISHRIRLEREACCDARAAACCGAGSNYAGALYEFAKRRVVSDGPTPEAAMAMGDPRRPSGLLDRVRRLTLPGYCPSMRLPWTTLALLSGIAALALACIKQGADEAVVLAEHFLSPKERVERMAEIEKDYMEIAQGEYGEEDKITLSGRIVTEDGKPLPQDGRYFTIHSQTANHGITSSCRADADGFFSTKVEYGALDLNIKAPGYAPLWLGPLRTDPGGAIEGLVITLNRGFAAKIQVVDPEGTPIPGVEFTGYYNTPTTSHSYAWDKRHPLTADAQGVATVDDGSTIPLMLTGVTPGFEETQWKDIQLEPDRIVTLTMAPAFPTEGVVVAAKDGKPVSGAEFRLVTQSGAWNMNYGPEDGPIIATSDDRGRFRMDSLRKDTRYYYLVEAPGFRREIMSDVTAGQVNLKIEMHPPLAVRGHVLGPEYAERYRDKPFIWRGQSFNTPGSDFGGSPQRVELQVRDGVGYFEFGQLWAGEVTIHSGEVRKTINLTQSIDDVSLDLRPEAKAAPAPTREVVIGFSLPEAAPLPTGKIRVDYRQKFEDRHWSPLWPDIEDGHVRLTMPVPNKIRYECDGTIGYWFPDEGNIEIPQGDGPFTVTIQAEPAGAIYGSVFEQNGEPAGGIMVSVATVKKPQSMEGKNLGVEGKSGTSEYDTFNKFNLAPLPLDGTYVAVAHRKQTYVLSQPIELTDEKPIVQIQLTMPEGVGVNGRVLDEDGNPVPGVKVKFDYSTPYSHGFGTEGAPTAPDGSFAFEHINRFAPGTYTLRFEAPGWQPAREELKFDSRPLEIHLKRGLTLTGRVIDAETGKPLEGIEVYTIPKVLPGEDYTAVAWMGYFDAEKRTDLNGEFRFDQLSDRPHTIHCRSAQETGEVIANGGQAEPVELRVKCP